MTETSQSWDREYRARGIPSSIRDDASTTVIWALDNWRYISPQRMPTSALDIGCGTGRNALYIASCGASVLGFDFSKEAVDRALARKRDEELPLSVTFVQHDLTKGLPAESGTIDFVTDIFVYKHQMEFSTRKQHRSEIKRVLRPDGKLLVSLAEIRDHYYSRCPLYGGAPSDDPLYVVDSVINAGSVLYSLDSLVREFGDTFELLMSWLKVKDGSMHGQTYTRYTLATIWEVKP